MQARKLAEMTPGFTGAEIENLVNTAITEAVHRGKDKADLDDFEYARDRLMMGIERKRLSMSDKDRLATALHEAGHAIVCYFTPNAKKLYKATIVSRGSSLGATFMVPDESDMLSTNKEKCLANIDVAAVRKYGMFGDDAGFASIDYKDASSDHNAMIDDNVKKILDESFERVTSLLRSKEKEIRALAKNLFWFDYLDHNEMEKVINGDELPKEKVRVWDREKEGEYIIKF